MIQGISQLLALHKTSRTNTNLKYNNHKEAQRKLQVKYKGFLLHHIVSSNRCDSASLTQRIMHELSLIAPQHPKNATRKIMPPMAIISIGAEYQVSPMKLA